LIVDTGLMGFLAGLVIWVVNAQWFSPAGFYSVSAVLGEFAITTLLVFTVRIYPVVRFGGSPGKLLMKLRIVPMHGGPLTYKHAVLREATGYGFHLWGTAASLAAISALDSPSFHDLPGPQQSALLTQHLQALWWMTVQSVLSRAWALAEVVAYFVTPERRAMHDLVAGTVVVMKGPDFITAADIVPQPRRSLLG
jgi:uncharacterized RDD family membrane protein YckC